MSDFLNHPEFYNQSVCLSQDELDFPIKVIRQFFYDYSLSDIRTIHDEIEEVCLTTDAPPFAHGSQRADFLYYLNNLIRVLEAAFVLAEIKSPLSKEPKATPH